MTERDIERAAAEFREHVERLAEEHGVEIPENGARWIFHRSLEHDPGFTPEATEHAFAELLDETDDGGRLYDDDVEDAAPDRDLIAELMGEFEDVTDEDVQAAAARVQRQLGRTLSDTERQQVGRAERGEDLATVAPWAFKPSSEMSRAERLQFMEDRARELEPPASEPEYGEGFDMGTRAGREAYMLARANGASAEDFQDGDYLDFQGEPEAA